MNDYYDLFLESDKPQAIELNTVTQGNCMDLLPRVASGSVDMVLCDLPYGTTQNKWDYVIPFEPLWAQYRRICKPSAAIVLTAAQPFTSALIMSKIDLFKYSWVWDKVNRKTGFLNAKKQPLRITEDVAVFYKQQPTYHPQMKKGIPYKVTIGSVKSSNYGKQTNTGMVCDNGGMNYPLNLISIPADERSIGNKKLHPTQKPVALWEYLIRTYTNEGDTVLDNCCGSGTTGVACQNTCRNFIQFELNPEYCEIARSRLKGIDEEKKK